jgi:L-rhamnose isomerase
MSHKLSILIFIFTLAQTAISEIDFIPLTQDKLKVITQLFDNKYHFIVLESLVMEELRSMLPVGSNIFYYTHNCKENRDLVKACDHAHHTAILLIYNKVMMEY